MTCRVVLLRTRYCRFRSMPVASPVAYAGSMETTTMNNSPAMRPMKKPRALLYVSLLPYFVTKLFAAHARGGRGVLR